MTERKYFGESPIHPGILIRERFIVPSGKKPADLCRDQSGISEPQLSKVLNGKAKVTAEIARNLGHIFNVSPMIFLELQNRYDLSLAEQKAQLREREVRRNMERPA